MQASRARPADGVIFSNLWWRNSVIMGFLVVRESVDR